MKSYKDIINETAEFLSKKRIKVSIVGGEAINARDVVRFEKQIGAALPRDLVRFYEEVSCPFLFSWSKGEKDSGCFSLPDLMELVGKHKQQQNQVQWMSKPGAFSRCQDPEFNDAALAIVKRMSHWLPFWDEGNGDTFCLDLKCGEVVFDNHSWFDGFNGDPHTTGLVGGNNFCEFLENWSKFCFMCPTSLWWMSCAKDGRIDWNRKHFHPDYVRVRQ